MPATRLLNSLLVTMLSLESAALAAAAIGDSSANTRASVTVYTARTIITLDEQRPRVPAIAIAGDRIVAAGTLKEIETTLADQTLTLDRRFADKVLVPGFINQHDHPWLAALTLSSNVLAIEDWQLPGRFFPRAESPASYRQQLRALVDGHQDPVRVFYSWGYHALFHGELGRTELNAISRTVPIVIWHRSGHEFIMNDQALGRFGIDQAMIDVLPESAQEQIDLARGHFWEQGALAVVPALFGDMAAPEHYLPGLAMIEKYWHAAGTTVAAEPGGLTSRALMIMQNKVLGDASTPFRMLYIPDGKSLALQHPDAELLAETAKVLDWAEGMSRFLPRQVKLFADGAIFSQLMQMKAGYLDGHDGEWMMPLDVFARAFRTYWDAGYQIHVHQNGDKGLDMVLDTVAENMQRNPRQDHRTVIVHFGFSTPEQVMRIAELGAIVSANPYYPVVLADPYSKSGLGPKRAEQMVRLGDVTRAGISLSLHSDMPMAPAQPLFLMWCAVNRLTVAGNEPAPDQRISPEAALRAVTLNAAYSLQLEDQIGSIVTGKLANVTVLEQNPLTVDPMTIKDIGVWGTIQEGRILPVQP